MAGDPMADARAAMVTAHLSSRGIADARVLEAMARVPRHVFVPEAHRFEAYDDHPLLIGHGQTISQPYIVAFMTEALQVTPAHRVLEIGAGSGYQTAILAELAREVFSLEIVPDLAVQAERTLAGLGYRNVHVRRGDGYDGWPEQAPFDRILVAAAPAAVPAALVEQLVDGGILVVPVGGIDQELQVLRRTSDGVEPLRSLPVRFVPMVRRPHP